MKEVQDDLKEAISEIIFGKKDKYYTTRKCIEFSEFTSTFPRFAIAR